MEMIVRRFAKSAGGSGPRKPRELRVTVTVESREVMILFLILYCLLVSRTMRLPLIRAWNGLWRVSRNSSRSREATPPAASAARLRRIDRSLEGFAAAIG